MLHGQRVRILLILSIVFAVCPMASRALAQPGAPPAMVVVARAERGLARPTQTFLGTVQYPEVAKVAAEVDGRVDVLDIETGSRVKKGQRLIALSTDLPRKELEAAQASHQQLLSQLDIARIELGRMEQLIKKETVSAQEYDRSRFLVMRLEKEARSLEAESERLELKLEKAQPRAPFDGVVLERHVGRGEWLSAGSPIATLARDDQAEVMVSLPEVALRHARPGQTLAVQAGGQEREAVVLAVIPSGDVATRTFPVKLRMLPDPRDAGRGLGLSLFQGMEARVDVPAGDAVEALLVPRDAVLLNQGQHVLWVNAGGVATMVPVEILAREGMRLAVRARDNGVVLVEGAEVVVKGNERLRPGQQMQVQPANQGS